MSTYALEYPDGAVVAGLDWDARRAALDVAPKGTRWHRESDGALCGTVGSTMAQYHRAVERAAAAVAAGRFAR